MADDAKSDATQAAISPFGDAEERAPQAGIALCLSGGGYRAMVFHLGVLWRLNEFGYRSRLDRISSVSGGRAFAHKTIDVGSVLKRIFLPGTISDMVAKVYRKHLFAPIGSASAS
jgi:NTE family protein